MIEEKASIIFYPVGHQAPNFLAFRKVIKYFPEFAHWFVFLSSFIIITIFIVNSPQLGHHQVLGELCALCCNCGTLKRMAAKAMCSVLQLRYP